MNLHLDCYIELQEQVQNRLNEFIDKVEGLYKFFRFDIPWQRQKVHEICYKILVPLKQTEILAQEYANICLKNQNRTGRIIENMFHLGEENEKEKENSVENFANNIKPLPFEPIKSNQLKEDQSHDDYETKKKTIMEYIESNGRKEASHKFNIPQYLLSHWQKKERKGIESRGRKTNHNQMESDLCAWMKESLQKGMVITQRQIRRKAQELTPSEEFKGSKGWLEKFFRRHPEIFYEYKIKQK